MPNNNNSCAALQRSLAWCQGTPELPGVRRRLYYTAKSNITAWPTLAHDAKGRVTAASYTGNFTLLADAKWYHIDILGDKSKLSSDPQGEAPSQTQLNKLQAIHPGVGPEASELSAYLNNGDNVFIVQDMKGRYRVVGSELFQTKCTVAQDNGEGPTGTTSTTINVEATDEVPAPFYVGTLVTEDGELNCGTSS